MGREDTRGLIMSALMQDARTSASADRESSSQQAVTTAWHVLHTKSRQEKILSNALTEMGIDHFLPLVRQARFYGRHKLFVEVPLFPSYLFLRGSIDDVYRADRTKRVARIVPVVNQRQIDWELGNIRLALERSASFDIYSYLTKGVRVEVRAGPLRGVQGIVSERIGMNRLILQVEMLGRALSVEIDASLLDRIQ